MSNIMTLMAKHRSKGRGVKHAELHEFFMMYKDGIIKKYGFFWLTKAVQLAAKHYKEPKLLQQDSIAYKVAYKVFQAIRHEERMGE